MKAKPLWVSSTLGINPASKPQANNTVIPLAVSVNYFVIISSFSIK